MTPRLSVVVPFYNVGEYIGACLDSIRRQTWTDFEAILVDDGSPDDSAVVAKEFCAQDSRFRIVQQDNAGPGPARDTGIREASGEYLAFVDGDDLVSWHGFAALIRTLDRTGSDFAGGNARRFNNSFGVRPSWLHRQSFARVRHATHVSEFADLVLDRMLWNKVYRRSFWTEFGNHFPPIRYEDYPVALKAHLDATGFSTRRSGRVTSNCSGGSPSSATTADYAAVPERCPGRDGRASSTTTTRGCVRPSYLRSCTGSRSAT